MRHRSFTLVLSGGGGRGLAHVGVLKALEHFGYRPSAIVGVSMGAIVGASCALNAAWYSALVNMDTQLFPQPPRASSNDLRTRIRVALASERALVEMFLDKQLRIFSATWLAVRLQIGQLPEDVTWKHVSGIGFTIIVGSLFRLLPECSFCIVLGL